MYNFKILYWNPFVKMVDDKVAVYYNCLCEYTIFMKKKKTILPNISHRLGSVSLSSPCNLTKKKKNANIHVNSANDCGA